MKSQNTLRWRQHVTFPMQTIFKSLTRSTLLWKQGTDLKNKFVSWRISIRESAETKQSIWADTKQPMQVSTYKVWQSNKHVPSNTWAWRSMGKQTAKLNSELRLGSPGTTGEKFSHYLRQKAEAPCIQNCTPTSTVVWKGILSTASRDSRSGQRKQKCLDASTEKLVMITSETVIYRTTVQVPIEEVLWTQRLKWYGQVLRQDERNQTKTTFDLETVCKRPWGRPQKHWIKLIAADMRKCELRAQIA